jgi:hypothetical protein
VTDPAQTTLGAEESLEELRADLRVVAQEVKRPGASVRRKPPR